MSIEKNTVPVSVHLKLSLIVQIVCSTEKQEWNVLSSIKQQRNLMFTLYKTLHTYIDTCMSSVFNPLLLKSSWNGESHYLHLRHTEIEAEDLNQWLAHLWLLQKIRFHSQVPTWGSQPSVTPVTSDQMSSSDLLGQQALKWCTYMQVRHSYS